MFRSRYIFDKNKQLLKRLRVKSVFHVFVASLLVVAIWWSSGNRSRASAVYSSLMAVVVVPFAEPARADWAAERSRPGVGKRVLTEPNPDLATEPTTSQTYRLRWVSSCIRMCGWKFQEKPNARLQIRHRYGFTPKWTVWWERECFIASAAAVRSTLEKFLICSGKRRIMTYWNSIFVINIIIYKKQLKPYEY